MVQHKVVTHYEDKDLHVQGETLGGLYFVHCTVEKYTHRVQKKIDVLFEEVKQGAKDAGFDAVYTYTENHKFAEYLGGALLETLELEGKSKGLYRWQ